jgi:hypothetical protein
MPQFCYGWDSRRREESGCRAVMLELTKMARSALDSASSLSRKDVGPQAFSSRTSSHSSLSSVSSRTIPMRREFSVRAGSARRPIVSGDSAPARTSCFPISRGPSPEGSRSTRSNTSRKNFFVRSFMASANGFMRPCEARAVPPGLLRDPGAHSFPIVRFCDRESSERRYSCLPAFLPSPSLLLSARPPPPGALPTSVRCLCGGCSRARPS